MSNVNENPDGDQNPLDAIRENLARKIVEWDPEPGDSVVGYVTQIEYVPPTPADVGPRPRADPRHGPVRW